MHNNRCGGVTIMDNNFINDDTSIPLISRRDLVIIIIAGSVSVFSGLPLTNPVDPSFELAHLLNSVNIVGMTFASGLFSFLTAGLLFSSRASRFYLQRRIDEVGVKYLCNHCILFACGLWYSNLFLSIPSISFRRFTYSVYLFSFHSYCFS